MCRSLAFLVLKPFIKVQFLGQLELPGAKLPDLLSEDSGYFLENLHLGEGLVAARHRPQTDSTVMKGSFILNSGQNVVFCVLMIKI